MLAATENYVEDVVPGFQCEKSRPYLLYRSKDDEVPCLHAVPDLAPGSST